MDTIGWLERSVGHSEKGGTDLEKDAKAGNKKEAEKTPQRRAKLRNKQPN